MEKLEGQALATKIISPVGPADFHDLEGFTAQVDAQDPVWRSGNLLHDSNPNVQAKCQIKVFY
jgi:hypothetical protein